MQLGPVISLSALAAAPAAACVIPLPSCETEATGAWSELWSDLGQKDVVIIEYDTEDGGPDRVFLASCTNRQAVVVGDLDGDYDTATEAADVFRAILDGPEALTLRQVRARLAAQGTAALIETLPGDHCACGEALQSFTFPQCPDF